MHFEIYRESSGLTGLLSQNSSGAGQWRWRLRAGNNKVISSGESYHNKDDCLHAIGLLINTTTATPINVIG